MGLHPFVARVCVCVPWQELRKTIVSCIMATDMSLHFDLVDETKKCVAEGDYTFEDVNDQVPVWCCACPPSAAVSVRVATR